MRYLPVRLIVLGVDPTTAAQAIDRAFRTARELAPSIVFIDEFQALFASREVEGATGYVARSRRRIGLASIITFG